MKLTISVEIPRKLLEDIQKNIEGKNRSEKVVKCVEKGFEILTGK